jgi:SAM-dependent methyltransferase
MNTQLTVRSIVKGLATRVPYVDRLANSAAGASVGASYYYAVWLRHLVAVSRHVPSLRWDVVGELGPGDGLGLGLCALLSGARRYIGLDRMAFALKADNLGLLSELQAMFMARAPIPDERAVPGVYPLLDDYAFPHYLLSDATLAASLTPARVEAIADALRNPPSGATPAMLGYAAPWDAQTNIEEGTVDLLLSQAVMEHVDDVEATYAAMRRWLKPDGVMSHRIDYSCHGITHDWYGHWLVSDPMWRVARGKRAYFINRLPHSGHLAALDRTGFEVVAVDATTGKACAPADRMQVAFAPDDLCIKGAHVIARPRQARSRGES